MSNVIDGNKQEICDVGTQIRDTVKYLSNGYQDKLISLKPLADFFKLYGIRYNSNLEVELQYNDDKANGPCLIIHDKNNDMIYESTIIFDRIEKDDSRLNDNKPKFLVRIHPKLNDYEIERIYYVNGEDDKPIREQLVIYDDYYNLDRNHQIIFKRDYLENKEFDSSDNGTLSIIYNRAGANKTKSNTNDRVLLLSDSYGEIQNGSQTWRSSTQADIKKGSNPKTHFLQTIVNDNNLVFNIGEMDKNLKRFFKGICVENMESLPHDYYPLKTNIDKIPLNLDKEDKDVSSVLFFRGNLYSSNEQSIIIKKINGRLYIVFNDGKSIVFPVLSEGIINSNDIRTIIDFLESRYGESTFIQNVIINLQVLLDRLEHRKYDIFDDSSILNPELLFNEPIDSILDLFQENPEQYFKYMENRITSELPKQFIK